MLCKDNAFLMAWSLNAVLWKKCTSPGSPACAVLLQDLCSDHNGLFGLLEVPHQADFLVEVAVIL